jgi:PAS domain S-box-containing protein
MPRKKKPTTPAAAPPAAPERLLALERKGRLLEAVLRQMPAGLVVVQAPGGIVEVVNDRFKAMSGLDLAPGDRLEDRLDGIVIRDADGSIRRRENYPMLRSLTRGETIEGLETIYERADGTRVVASVSSAPIRGADGSVEGAVAIFLDVTDRARLHQAVANGRARLEAVLEAMPSGVIIGEAPSGVISYANRCARALLRADVADPNELAAHCQPRFRRPDGAPIDPAALPFRRALEKGETSCGEEIAFDVGRGQLVYFRCNAAPVRDHTRRVVGGVCAFDDITGAVEAKQEHERVDRFRELFVGMLGHDLRSPLASIVTGAGLLLQHAGAAPEVRRTADRITAAATRMRRMIEQLLDLTRSRLAGGIHVAITSTNLTVVARRIATELEAEHQGRAINLTAPGPLRCCCDPDRMGQVLSNLVGNALRHGAPGAPIDVVLAQDGPEIRIVVHNVGPPIPATLLPLLFDPFWRASPAAKPDPAGGLGLGLYISQQIVMAHGGRIEVESTAEKGTTFTVVLPGGTPTSAT